MFMFDLEVENLMDGRADAVAEACTSPDAWPVTFVPARVERRWFGMEKAYPAVLEIEAADARGSILADAARRDAHALALRRDAIPRLANTVRIIARHFPEGFGLIATYSGSPIQHHRTLPAEALAAIVERSELNEFTRYRVSAGTPS